MKNTAYQFDKIITDCRAIFERKLTDYGTAWRILRLPSLTDQIYIKANRIRTIQGLKVMLVDESEAVEFIAIINYAIIALIQIKKGIANQPDMPAVEAIQLFDYFTEESKQLMLKKNHDYGEAWREMRISSITDLILQKILRVKQIEDNDGKTIASEGLDTNYHDMLNYSVFALILMNEKTTT